MRLIPFLFVICALPLCVILFWLNPEYALLVWANILLIPFFFLGIFDFYQKKSPVLRNYPIIGRLRFLLQEIRPQIRQYFIEAEDEEVPYSRQQHSMVTERSKAKDGTLPFGTLQGVYDIEHVWINHSLTPMTIENNDFRIHVGGEKSGYKISIINISGTSFGAVSAQVIESFNKGASIGGFAHNTGEGGITPYHQKHNGDLIWQIGTGYFGCRNHNGEFDSQKFSEKASLDQVKMIEIKLSQGAKPGSGGVLLAPKVTSEIAAIRGVQAGVNCISPPKHSAFYTPESLLRFIEELRSLSGGKPIGFKLAIGHPWEFLATVKAMVETGITPDFITVDGAEGGTGAAPAEFSDRVGSPLRDAVVYVDNALRAASLRDQIKIGASGKIVSAFDIARICALGADWVNMARPFMFATGCIQARTCHNGNCPTGIATMDPNRSRAIDVETKALAISQFQKTSRQALAKLIGAAGLQNPNELTRRHLVHRVSQTEIMLASQIYPDAEQGVVFSKSKCDDPRIARYWAKVSKDSFQPKVLEGV